MGWPGAGLDPYPARETKCQALMLDHLRHFFKNTDRNRPDFLFGLKAEGSEGQQSSSLSDGSCFDGPLDAVSLHRLQRGVPAP